jgi:hypothetical protein
MKLRKNETLMMRFHRAKAIHNLKTKTFLRENCKRLNLKLQENNAL